MVATTKVHSKHCSNSNKTFKIDASPTHASSYDIAKYVPSKEQTGHNYKHSNINCVKFPIDSPAITHSVTQYTSNKVIECVSFRTF